MKNHLKSIEPTFPQINHMNRKNIIKILSWSIRYTVEFFHVWLIYVRFETKINRRKQIIAKPLTISQRGIFVSIGQFFRKITPITIPHRGTEFINKIHIHAWQFIESSFCLSNCSSCFVFVIVKISVLFSIEKWKGFR